MGRSRSVRFVLVFGLALCVFVPTVVAQECLDLVGHLESSAGVGCPGKWGGSICVEFERRAQAENQCKSAKTETAKHMIAPIAGADRWRGME